MLRLRRRHPGGRILVVTHSLVVKAMWLVAAGRPVEDMWVGSELAGGSLTELRHDDGAWTVERLGDVGHVEEVAACS
jgi:probable phosphoglycerate mutase